MNIQKQYRKGIITNLLIETYNYFFNRIMRYSSFITTNMGQDYLKLTQDSALLNTYMVEQLLLVVKFNNVNLHSAFILTSISAREFYTNVSLIQDAEI